MKFSLETVARLYASGRNYANMAIGFAAGAGVISAAQDKTLTDSLVEIGSGISMVVHGATSIYQVGLVVLGPIVGGVLAWYAQRSAKTENKQAAVVATANDPNDPKAKEATVAILKAVTETKSVEIQGAITAAPEIANAVPSAKVVSQ